MENEYHLPNFSIKKLSQTCNMSESYFRRKFTETYGISPKKYLCNLRLAMAKRMLRDGRKNITEISEKCGFASVYHFSRAFKLSIGESPKEFAKKQSL
jgi:AraC-like DNA-binding protein